MIEWIIKNKDLYTAIAATVAAIAALWNIWKDIFKGRDRLLVRFGAAYDGYDDRVSGSVQNLSPHESYLDDIGFIYLDGTKSSLYELDVIASAGSGHVFGSSEPKLASRQRGYGWLDCSRDKKVVVGFYARCNSHRFYRMDFSDRTQLHTRLWLRLRLYWQCIWGNRW